jgi:cobalt-zinc-cadmium efflux system protein
VILLSGWAWVDPLLAIGIAAFVGYNVVRNLWETIQLFLQKIPEDFDLAKFEKEVRGIEGVTNVHDVHVWTMDGVRNILSMHVEIPGKVDSLKEIEKIRLEIRERVSKMGRFHITIEVERDGALCLEEKD